MIIRHDTGAIEIHTDGKLLILLEDEYKRAVHRGRTVVNNRPVAADSKQEEDARA